MNTENIILLLPRIIVGLIIWSCIGTAIGIFIRAIIPENKKMPKIFIFFGGPIVWITYHENKGDN